MLTFVCQQDSGHCASKCKAEGLGVSGRGKARNGDGAFVSPSGIDVTTRRPRRKLFVPKHSVQSQQLVRHICHLSSCTSAQDSVVRSERSANGALKVSAVPHTAWKLPFKGFVFLCIHTD